MKPKKAPRSKVTRQLARKNREISRLKGTVVELSTDIRRLEKELAEEQKHDKSQP